MEASEVYQVLASYKEAIDAILNRLDELDHMVESYHQQYDDRFHKIESTVNDEILGPAQRAFDKYDYDKRLGEFHGKYGSQLDSFNEQLRKIQGDDSFDLAADAFKNYEALGQENRPDMDSYVAELVKQLGQQLEAIREAINAPKDAVVEVEKTGTTAPVVEIESPETQGKEEKAGHSEPEKPAVRKLADEKGKPEPTADVEVSESEEVEDDPAEVEKLVEQYAKMAAKGQK